ncbi:hypothetical protein BG006_007117 [Podila minutissima]|uniref:Cytochrome P450 n=1 Tax=Podila minutissima TaxID=64525 RepID=A0A9P5SHQ1_9FUNG|nr:hypothetical protein BG006_007117 [Podila minutissima]
MCIFQSESPRWRFQRKLASHIFTLKAFKDYHDKNLAAEHAYALMEKRHTEGSQHQGDIKKRDLLDPFLEATEDEGHPLPDAMTKDFILNFMITGRDTTAQALSWIFYLLLRTGSGPEVWQRLVQEMDEVLQGSELTCEMDKQQKYADDHSQGHSRRYRFEKKKPPYFIQCDVTNYAQQAAMFAAAETHFGGVDIIANNAGITEPIPQPRTPAYSAAKFGVVELTRSLKDFPDNIRVNAVTPSFADTKSIDGAREYITSLNAMLTVDQVIDAFMLFIEDDSYSGDAARVTPKYGVSVVGRTQRSTKEKAKL